VSPQRIAVRFFVSPDPHAAVDLEPFIPLFHRFIQQGALEGLLIDVADYAHVPEGPGVLLVGHDVDYAIDCGGGQASLLVTRKRFGDLPLAEVVHDLLRKAVIAIQAIEGDGSAGLRFATDRLEMRSLDRLSTPNSAEQYETLRSGVAPVLEKLFEGGCEFVRVDAGDERKPLAIGVAAPEAVPVETLVQRLGGGPAVRSPKQSDWDIEVEDLAKLREEGADFQLIDVREQREFEICHLGGELIPLGTLPEKLGELDAGAHVVVHCRTGARSAKAVKLLRDAGFANAWNVRGGILAWIDRIDPSLTRY
jgi:rhodanese-related sulfurtransferase